MTKKLHSLNDKVPFCVVCHVFFKQKSSDFLQVNVDICDVTRMIALFIEYGLWDKVSSL